MDFKKTVQLPRKTRFWKYLLLALAGVLAVVAAIVPRPAPMPSYRRYTSPALPDGVRYTFLYPATLDNVFSHSMSTRSKDNLLQVVTVSKKDSRLPGAALWQNWFKPEAEFVFVVVEKSNTALLKSSRIEKQRANHVEVEHTVLVDDPRAHEHFRFWHASDYGTTSFNQHDSVVMNSFHILLPGEPVSTP